MEYGVFNVVLLSFLFLLEKTPAAGIKPAAGAAVVNALIKSQDVLEPVDQVVLAEDGDRYQ